MLDEQGVDYRYRDYRKEPLSVAEVERVLALLGLAARDVLRRRDRAFKELGLSGDEPEGELIAAIAEHPTLLERPIGVTADAAALGRPPENLLALIG